MSPLKKTSTFNSDTLYLKYSVKDSGGSKVLPIDVSDAAIGETEIFSMVDRIDLLKIPMELPGDAEQDPGGIGICQWSRCFGYFQNGRMA